MSSWIGLIVSVGGFDDKLVALEKLRVVTIQACLGGGRNFALSHDGSWIRIEHHLQQLLCAIDLGMHETGYARSDVTVGTGHI